LNAPLANAVVGIKSIRTRECQSESINE
jgi:hypothetical protein